jgi:tetratricopeptide (TPR) repeat protein
MTLASLRKMTECIDTLTKSLKIDPTNETTNYYLGNSYFFTNNFEEALIYYQKVIEINPNNARAFNQIGFAHANMKHFE